MNTLKMITFFFVLLSCFYHSQKTDTRYIDLLKKSTYQKKMISDLPDFTYQSENNTDLTELRKKYRLDKVAGSGSDINRITNLLQWMHDTVPHEDEYNLEILTAPNIIETYKNKGLAQGCYPLAIAMNDIFLSMGFMSRIVICFPEDFKHPNGGHVINSVYVPSLKKWVWMDPQYNAYLKDEHGNLLGISEVRERLIKQKPLFLNKTADYHHQATNRNYYLESFMAGHLYRFISPANNAFNAETREKGKIMTYIELIPSNGKIPASGTFESHKANDIQVITYHTDNPDLFWKIPE